MQIRPGTIIAGTYEIVGPLGRGGMGELFRARNARTERKVALKLLRPDAKSRADAIERFHREARAAGLINSDYVTQVLDIQDDPVHGIAIVFELLEGENLLDYLRRTGVMTIESVYPLVEQILQGLQDAHRVGIIHRDLKPSNVFLVQRPDGALRVKILDFGISKLPKTMAKVTLTEPGQALGSFMFMPPEQIQKAANVDQRADLYALGTLVFQAMTGHLPYNARSMIELVQMKTSADPRTLSQVTGKPFPPALQAWVDRCLKRNPGERFQDAGEAAAAWKAMMSSAVAPPPYTPAAAFGVSMPQFPSPVTGPPQGYPHPPPPVPPPAYPQASSGSYPAAYGAPPPYTPPLPPPPAMPLAGGPAQPFAGPPAMMQPRAGAPWLLIAVVVLVIGAAVVMGAVVYTLFVR